MARHLVNFLILPATFLAVAVGSWAFMNRSDSVGTNSPFGACWSKTGSAAQIDCTSALILKDVSRKAVDPARREAAVFAVVRDTERFAASDPQLSQACHSAMHPVGRAEGARYAKAGSPPKFPDGASQLCTAGYVHGVAEGYLASSTDPDVAAVFPKLCHQADAREGCAHGIGHALLKARSDRPVTTSVSLAAERCRELPAEFPTNCLNGVYMELALRREPTAIAPADFVRACEANADAADALTCWGYLVQNLNTNDVSLADMPKWCARPTLPGQYTCVEEYGRMLGSRDVAMCAASSDRDGLQRRCIEGAIGLQVGSGHVSKRDASAACDTIDEADLAAHCHSAVVRYSRGREQVEAA